MSEPTAFPLDESKLPFKIPKDTKPREKIMKLGQMITDRIPAKNRPLTAEDPEYWGLASIVTDEMADIALTMKLRTPYTVEELWKMNKVTEEQKPHFQELLDQMSYIGLLEYDYGYHYDHNGRTAPPSERRYILPAGAASGACQVL